MTILRNKKSEIPEKLKGLARKFGENTKADVEYNLNALKNYGKSIY